MAEDTANLAFQAHLAEFVALRQEMLEMIKWRETLVFSSLGIAGALLSFGLSSDQNCAAPLAPHSMALYLVPPITSAIGGLWFVNSLRIHRIGAYVRDELKPKVNEIVLASSLQPTNAMKVFGWESSSERLMGKWTRRVLEWVVLLIAFVFAGVMAQYLIIAKLPGSIIQRTQRVDSISFYFVNCVFITLSFLLFVFHLWTGRKHRVQS